MADERPAAPLPLRGVRVLDLTQIYNGPYATFLMAMAGAEVIKIEPPGGEYLRRRDARAGAFMPFAMLNGCKKSVSLNLKSAKGRKIFLDLVEDADVVVENFSPGVMDRLRLGYDELRARNPAIIFASGSGYGQDGGYRDLMAMDLTVQAMSGVMSVTGYPDGPPTKAGAALCDFFGGVHLYGAIVTALFRRADHWSRCSHRCRHARCRLPDHGVEHRDALRRARRPALAHRQPSRRALALPLQRLPDGRRLHRHHLQQRQALAGPAGRHRPRSTSRATRGR